MPHRLTPAQIRGARAMLDWSMVDLAEASHVSVSMVKRMESAAPQPLAEGTCATVCGALEREGVTFLPDEGMGPGVRAREP